MNVTCPNCATVYRVDPAKVPDTGVRARCSVCNAVFAVRRDELVGARPASVPAGTVAGHVTPTAPSPAAPEPTAETPRPRAPAPATGAVSAPASATAAPATPARATPAPAAPAAAAGPASPPSPSTPGRPAGFSPPAVPVAATRPATPPGPQAPVPPASPAVRPTPAFAAPTSAPAGTPAPSQARPAAGPGTRPVNPFLSQDPALKARRLARALISDMVVYHPAKRQEGLRDGTLKQLFEDEIKKSWEEYADQVGREVADRTPYFKEALNEILAGGRQIF